MISRIHVHAPSLGALLVLLTCVCQSSAQEARTPGAQEGQRHSDDDPDRDSATASDPKAESPPSWAADARWYEVVIPKFHNGDPSNDRSGTLPWTTEWPTFEGPRDAPAEEAARSEWFTAAMTPCLGRLYGGDLKGLEQRLPYLKKLGVNTLYIGSVFHQTVEGTSAPPDLRHIDDTIGVKGSKGDVTGESADPKTWQFTRSDRRFVNFVKRAHREGFRVVIHGRFGAFGALRDPFVEDDRYILDVTRRWMDPNGDGDTSDGVDGWMLDSNSRRADGFWNVWRKQVSAVNPDAIVIWQLGTSSKVQRLGPLDVAVNLTASSSILRLLGKGGSATGDESSAGSPGQGEARHAREARGALGLLERRPDGGEPVRIALGDLTSWRPVMGSRVLDSLGPGSAAGESDSSSAGAKPSEEAYKRWRLATILQHFLPGAPVTMYGDEVGVYGGPTIVNAERPMWWDDLDGAKTKSPDYRGDSFALIQWLHQLRQDYAPLRHGDLRPVLWDEDQEILAFARTLPLEEVVLVMNYGSEKRLVNLPAGRPRELVAVLSPQLDPGAARGRARRTSATHDYSKRAELQVGGSRQFVNDGGRIRVWVNPMSARVVLASGPESGKASP